MGRVQDSGATVPADGKTSCAYSLASPASRRVSSVTTPGVDENQRRHKLKAEKKADGDQQGVTEVAHPLPARQRCGGAACGCRQGPRCRAGRGHGHACSGLGTASEGVAWSHSVPPPAAGLPPGPARGTASTSALPALLPALTCYPKLPPSHPQNRRHPHAHSPLTPMPLKSSVQ